MVAELAPSRMRSTFTAREFARLAADVTDHQIHGCRSRRAVVGSKLEEHSRCCRACIDFVAEYALASTAARSDIATTPASRSTRSSSLRTGPGVRWRSSSARTDWAPQRRPCSSFATNEWTLAKMLVAPPDRHDPSRAWPHGRRVGPVAQYHQKRPPDGSGCSLNGTRPTGDLAARRRACVEPSARPTFRSTSF